MSKGTKHRTIRIPDEIWQAAKDRAEHEGVSLSDIIREALRSYAVAD